MGFLDSRPSSEVVRAFEQLGWNVARQKGSHIHMKKPGERALLTIPEHKTVKVGTLKRLIRDAGITVDEFIEACRK